MMILITALLTLFSCALVGLIILTQGSVSGLKAIAVSMLGIILVASIVAEMLDMGLSTGIWIGLSIGLVQWLPIVILAQTLRVTKSLGAMLLTGMGLALVVVLLQFALWPEVEDKWVMLIEQSLALSPVAELQIDPGIAANLKQHAQTMGHMMTLVLGASLYLLCTSILLFARSMQAKLADSEGFREEFRAVVLGKRAALGALVLLILGLWLQQDWIISMLLVVMTAFMFQGIAVVHVRTAASKYRAFLIGLFYTLLLIFPQILAATAITGLIDNWLVLRKSANAKTM